MFEIGFWLVRFFFGRPERADEKIENGKAKTRGKEKKNRVFQI